MSPAVVILVSAVACLAAGSLAYLTEARVVGSLCLALGFFGFGLSFGLFEGDR